MQTSGLNERISEHIRPVIEGLGYFLVELKANRNRHNLHVSVVIYKPSGVTLGDCSTVHRTIQPRIELLEDTRDLHIEVASPGIERRIGSTDEYRVFAGKGVSIMRRGTQEWVGGIIDRSDEQGVTIRIGEAAETIPFDDILKARLDYSQEVG